MGWLITVLILLILILIAGVGFVIYTLFTVAQIIQETHDKTYKLVRTIETDLIEDREKTSGLWKNLGKSLTKIIDHI